MSNSEFQALVEGRHSNPFAVLGVHQTATGRVVRTFQPGARSVELVDADDTLLARMQRLLPEGLFVADMPPRKRVYRLRITTHAGEQHTIDDCYRFPSTLGDLDLYLLGEGSDTKIYRKLGAHLRTVQGVAGVRFAVWAPNASRVSVVADFNGWDGRSHVMRLHPANGIWEIFIPGAANGTRYKYELIDRNGKLLPLKTDPFGSFHEPPPGNASVVFDSGYQWRDDDWMRRR